MTIHNCVLAFLPLVQFCDAEHKHEIRKHEKCDARATHQIGRAESHQLCVMKMRLDFRCE